MILEHGGRVSAIDPSSGYKRSAEEDEREREDMRPGLHHKCSARTWKNFLILPFPFRPMLRLLLCLAASLALSSAVFTGNATLPVGRYSMNAAAPQILLTTPVSAWVPYLFQVYWNQTSPNDGASIWEIRRYLPSQLHHLGTWEERTGGGLAFKPPSRLPRSFVPAPEPVERTLMEKMRRMWNWTPEAAAGEEAKPAPSDTLPPPTSQVDMVHVTTTVMCSSNHLVAVEVLECDMITAVSALDYCASNYMYDAIAPSPLELQIGFVSGVPGFGLTSLLGTVNNFFLTCVSPSACAAPLSECL